MEAEPRSTRAANPGSWRVTLVVRDEAGVEHRHDTVLSADASEELPTVGAQPGWPPPDQLLFVRMTVERLDDD
jgi:hypothetical protein